MLLVAKFFLFVVVVIVGTREIQIYYHVEPVGEQNKQNKQIRVVADIDIVENFQTGF
jgi:hypothetical protein